MGPINGVPALALATVAFLAFVSAGPAAEPTGSTDAIQNE